MMARAVLACIVIGGQLHWVRDDKLSSRWRVVPACRGVEGNEATISDEPFGC